MRLFDVPIDDDEDAVEISYQRLGVGAQMLLASRLLVLGHSVAIPLADDDGVDLIVDYQTLVQVKSTAQTHIDGAVKVDLRPKKARRQTLRSSIPEHIHIVAIYARELDAWWFMPREGISRAFSLYPARADARRDAWHIFSLPWGGTGSAEEARTLRAVSRGLYGSGGES